MFPLLLVQKRIHSRAVGNMFNWHSVLTVGKRKQTIQTFFIYIHYGNLFKHMVKMKWSVITSYLLWSRLMVLTHWGRDKMADISQTTFSNAFSWMEMHEFRLRFHWSLFLRFQLTIFQHWFRWWLGADQATSHYLNQWLLVYWRVYASLGLNETWTLKNKQSTPISLDRAFPSVKWNLVVIFWNISSIILYSRHRDWDKNHCPFTFICDFGSYLIYHETWGMHNYVVYKYPLNAYISSLQIIGNIF